MARRSYFVHFASVLAAALFLVPAQAATAFNTRVDPAFALQSLQADAQDHSVNIVGP